ncbi:MAG TPA: hypothetical protein VIW29_11940 [Polyangiaceae bacterium]
MSKKKLLAVCLLVGTALSCGSDKDPGKGAGPDAGGAGSDGPDSGSAGDDSDGNDGNDDEPGVTSTYEEVASVAKMIYDAVEAGEDVTPHIAAVLEAFGVPILEPDDADGALARIDAGLPFVTSVVVERMAAAYAEGRFVDVQGFSEGLDEQGVGLAYPFNLDDGSEYPNEFLGSLIYSFTLPGETMPDVPLEAGYILPSFVRELGQERARRTNMEGLDPAWGDGKLDPLQFTLLTFTIFAKPASGTETLSGAPQIKLLQADVIAKFVKDQLKGAAEDKVTSEVQSFIEVPLDKKDAAKVSVCGSLILYGHKVTITNTPDLLWHAPQTPNLTTVEMTLTFEDDYHDNWARAVIAGGVTDLTGCAFPRKGPIEGKAVEWSVSSGLEGHGAYDLTGATTNDLGKSTATWRTVTDDYPEACHVFEKQRDAVGATEAVVSGLLPGWSTVETIVTFLNPNVGTQGNDPLTVLYYELTADDTCHVE